MNRARGRRTVAPAMSIWVPAPSSDYGVTSGSLDSLDPDERTGRNRSDAAPDHPVSDRSTWLPLAGLHFLVDLRMDRTGVACGQDASGTLQHRKRAGASGNSRLLREHPGCLQAAASRPERQPGRRYAASSSRLDPLLRSGPRRIRTNVPAVEAQAQSRRPLERNQLPFQ